MQIINLTPSANNLSRYYKRDSSVLTLCDATDNSFSVSLPDASSVENVVFKFKKINSSNDVTIYGVNGQLIDGSETVVISDLNDCIVVESDGNNWWVTN